MDLSQYKPNSNKYKEEQAAKAAEKKIEKVVTGPVRTKKKGGFAKFLNLFIPEGTDIKQYIVQDVVVPAIKKTVSDSVDTVLYGGTRGHKGRGGLASKVSYTSYYDDRRGVREPAPARSSAYSYDDIIIDSRGEAEHVLDQMCELIATYDHVTVADLYELVGITAQYTDNYFGWTNLGTAEVVRARDGGFMLKLPRAVPIKK